LSDHPAPLHAHGSDARRLGWALAITATFMVLEVAGGLISGSLALLADAGHMLTDTAALALAWHWTPLESTALESALGFFREAWYGLLAATGVFTLACLAFVPVTGMTVAASLVLGPWTGACVAWVGATSAAALGYLAGQLLWRDSVRRLAGPRLHALSQRMGRHGVLSSALLRTVPLAPFMVVNLVAGASDVRARDFVLGTALGILPGTLLLAFAADRVKDVVVEPEPLTSLAAALSVVALLGVTALLRRWTRRRRPMAAPRA